eukprot:CAMPEP_0174339746 /NCGR_PEP_ID=MMETSP0810-20121108/24149_1 /TAXON_ID=73025 ORGANISM="Eutreptiella gymnastica-like, Strain CCMP1594" /NCGR_SAMPLE_ID=MMETSP0810 /ASSEMBLY_ACC=CAM_ASM_000659 /LENGTH=246 /DNA_ID=CAMNT_0015460549 /DNA_START=1676 /DNA_END=2416 /DNA_ORIENTATION=-
MGAWLGIQAAGHQRGLALHNVVQLPCVGEGTQRGGSPGSGTGVQLQAHGKGDLRGGGMQQRHHNAATVLGLVHGLAHEGATHRHVFTVGFCGRAKGCRTQHTQHRAAASCKRTEYQAQAAPAAKSPPQRIVSNGPERLCEIGSLRALMEACAPPLRRDMGTVAVVPTIRGQPRACGGGRTALTRLAAVSGQADWSCRFRGAALQEYGIGVDGARRRKDRYTEDCAKGGDYAEAVEAAGGSPVGVQD